MVLVIWVDGFWICCRFGEVIWWIFWKRIWCYGCMFILVSKMFVWDLVIVMFLWIVMYGCWCGLCRVIFLKGFCLLLCGICLCKVRWIELNGFISSGLREVWIIWLLYFESLLMELILEYLIMYLEVKKYCLLCYM